MYAYKVSKNANIANFVSLWKTNVRKAKFATDLNGSLGEIDSELWWDYSLFSWWISFQISQIF